VTGDTTIVFGVPVPSTDPAFLAVVRFHILVGIVCVAAGIAAMMSLKRRGRHLTFGNAAQSGQPLPQAFITTCRCCTVRRSPPRQCAPVCGA
jgi:hypothetical protein